MAQGLCFLEMTDQRSTPYASSRPRVKRRRLSQTADGSWGVPLDSIGVGGPWIPYSVHNFAYLWDCIQRDWTGAVRHLAWTELGIVPAQGADSKGLKVFADSKKTDALRRKKSDICCF